MATFTFLTGDAWNSYSDLAGGTIVRHTPTLFSYRSATGYVVTLHGTSFEYDRQGLPIDDLSVGMFNNLDVWLGNVHLAHFGDLVHDLSYFVSQVLGRTSGVAGTTTPDMTAAYQFLRGDYDTITLSAFGRNVDGFDGNDTFNGGAGDDWFYGGRGADEYHGGGGQNGVSFLVDGTTSGVIIGNNVFGVLDVSNDGFGNAEHKIEGIRLLETSSLNDIVNLGYMDSDGYTIWLADGDDYATSYYGDATFYGGAGNDLIYANGVADGGAGQDSLGGSAHIAFWSTDDGGHGAVVNLSLGVGQIVDDGLGNTEDAGTTLSFYGTRFGDTFTAGAIGSDFSGNDGRDRLVGGAGTDYLFGGDGNDTIQSGSGDDEVEGGSGHDLMYGGLGHDHLGFWSVDAAGHGVTVNLGLASGQVVDDGYGNAETAGSFETLSGSQFGDLLTGSGGDNLLWGNDGNDTLNGGGGNDTLKDGIGNDLLNGGAGDDFLWSYEGTDTLVGGLGHDSFDFAAGAPAQGRVDTITDYVHLTDTIGIAQWWSVKLTGTALTSAQFISGAGRTTAATTAQLVIYDTTTGRLYFDADGSGAASSAVWVATLTNHAALTFQDFTVFS